MALARLDKNSLCYYYNKDILVRTKYFPHSLYLHHLMQQFLGQTCILHKMVVGQLKFK
jgi:hypothetical protein